MYRLGIDVGGTKIEGVVIDPLGHERLRLRRRTPQENGYRAIVQKIASMRHELLASIENSPHTLGICTPGAIDRTSGKLRFCNIKCMNGKSLQQDLRDEMDVYVPVANDANCFALAESVMGAGKGCHFIFGMVLGTGCGGGLVIDQKIWEGRTGIAGEWGHSTLYHDGKACYCGRKGCVERYLSGSALEDTYRTGEYLSVTGIVEARAKGNLAANRILDDFIDAFGRATADLITTFDPDIIILGGGLSNIADIYTDGRKRVVESIMGEKISTKITRNVLGDSAGVLGAALHGYEAKTLC